MKKWWMTLGLSAALAATAPAFAAGNVQLSHDGLTIGLITDMAGPYAALEGPGSELAAKMAIEDFGGKIDGKPIKLMVGDNQNKPDVASAIARRWIDQDHVDMLVGLGNSSVALAVQALASDKHVITMAADSGTTELTEDRCTKYGIHYVYDTHALAAGTGTAVVKQGGDSWYFITVDYAFGHSLEEDTAAVVKKLGGKVVGHVLHPLDTTDFSSYLLQAQASKAKVIALANTGDNFVNAVKQAHEFQITQHGQQLVGMLVFVNGVKSLGLETAQGLQFTGAWYWDQNAKSRAWAERFHKRLGVMPNYGQAGVYSAVLTYLNAVTQAGTVDADKVRDVLGKTDINDMFVSHGKILPNGLMLHDMFLMKVKTPAESHGDWDLLKVMATIPGKDAFLPLSASKCKLVKASNG
jgi:branched-chain amino acid transport system substrate-binding protein